MAQPRGSIDQNANFVNAIRMKIDETADPAARRIQKRGQKKKASILAGAKINGRIQVESVLEATFACAAMIDPRVQGIRPQPLSIDLNSGRTAATKAELLETHSSTGYRVKAYTPDFSLHLADGSVVYVETKPERLLDRDPVTVRLPEIFAELGQRLILVTDQELNKAITTNARHLRPYVGRELAPSASKKLHAQVQNPTKLSELMKNDLTQGDVLNAILHGVLRTDLRASPLSPSSELALAHGAFDHLEVLPL